MTDITVLQQQWQKDLTPIQEAEKQDIFKKEKYLEKLEKIGELYNEPKGLRHLSKPFFVAVRTPWLRSRKMKIEKKLGQKEGKIKEIAINTLSNLTDAVARDSARSAEFVYLETAIKQMQYTQDIVTKAANKCRNASMMEGAAAAGDVAGDTVPRHRVSADDSTEMAVDLAVEFAHVATDFAANRAARNATNAFREAEEAVQNLQIAVKNEIPQVNGALANEIASSNSTTLMMNAFGGMLSSFSNWDMAGQLNDAKGHLHGIVGQLGSTIDKLSREKKVIADAAIADARKTDKAIDSFAAELEYYMLPLAMRRPLEDTLMADKEIDIPSPVVDLPLRNVTAPTL